MFNISNGNIMTNNRKLQFLLETKLSTDEKVPKTGRVLRNKIFVIGFPPNCTEMDLEKFFSNFGLVRESRIVKDENGITKGYAFITFAKERSVVHALEYRGPLYFMDRKLSINPAIKKQHQFVQSERCISSSTSIDTPSDMSNPMNDYNSLTTTSIPPFVSSSQLNGTMMHHYSNHHPLSQPYFHLGLPSHPIYCSSDSLPVWHHYFSAMTNYPSCSYFPMVNNSSEVPMMSEINGNIYHNSMFRYPNIVDHQNKIFQ